MESSTATLRVCSLDFSGSVVDGPGVRSVLFLQGCSHQCLGCHNPATWDPEGGEVIRIMELAAELRRRVHNKKLTISGGEPLEQAEALILLLRELEDFDIVLYTGFELADVPPAIIHLLSSIKVGEYLENFRTTTAPFIGSSNQRFIRLRDSAS